MGAVNLDPPWWNDPCPYCGHRITAHRGEPEFPCAFCGCSVDENENLLKPGTFAKPVSMIVGDTGPEFVVLPDDV